MAVNPNGTITANFERRDVSYEFGILYYYWDGTSYQSFNPPASIYFYSTKHGDNMKPITNGLYPSGEILSGNLSSHLIYGHESPTGKELMFECTEINGDKNSTEQISLILNNHTFVYVYFK